MCTIVMRSPTVKLSDKQSKNKAFKFDPMRFSKNYLVLIKKK